MSFLTPNLQKFINDMELIKTLTINSLKIKYKRSKLGLSWSMLNPIFNITVIAFVFSHIMGMTYAKFAIFFFSGFLAWNLYSGSVVAASNSLINNEALIKKVPINLIIFPLVSVGINIVEFMLSMFTLTMLLVLVGLKFSLAILFVPVAFILLLLFTTGLALMVSIMTSFFRDFAHIFFVIMQLWFYLTPVLYPKTFLQGKSQILKYINPMVLYIDLFRDPIANGQLPPYGEIISAIILSCCVLGMGILIFNKYKSQVIFKL